MHNLRHTSFARILACDRLNMKQRSLKLSAQRKILEAFGFRKQSREDPGDIDSSTQTDSEMATAAAIIVGTWTWDPNIGANFD